MKRRLSVLLMLLVLLLPGSVARAYEVYWVDGYYKEVEVTERKLQCCPECIPNCVTVTVTYTKLVWVDGYWAVRCEPMEDCPLADPSKF